MIRILYGLPLLAFTLICFAPVPASAQTSKRDDKAYRKTAAELREDIWGWDLLHFKDRTVPDQYKSYSSIVLARYTDLSAGSTRSVRRGGANITEITRELIRLNDAAAVKEYSELSYTQLQKLGGASRDNKSSVFLGVRVIKADGKMTEINTDDIVLTKDEREERQAKLAIPDLQPGDMLDYYVAKELSITGENISSIPYYFSFYDDVPVLHYGVHCSIGKRFATEYRCYNGAPDFTNEGDDDGSVLLDVSGDNLLLIPPGMFWISPLRQFPVIQLNVVQGYSGMYALANARRPGELFKNQLAARIIRDEMSAINQSGPAITALYSASLAKKSDAVAEYYRGLRERWDSLSEDSLSAALYYMFRFDFMFNKHGAFDVESFVRMPEGRLNASGYAYLLSEYFKKNDLESELVLATSMYTPKMSEVLNRDDIRYLCAVHGKRDILFGATDLYSPAFYVPSVLEGAEGAIAVDMKGFIAFNANNYSQRPVSIPRTGPQENVHLEKLVVTPDPGSNELRVARSTTLTGHYKEDIQQHLLLLEDFYNYERAFFHEDRGLVARFEESKASRKVADELQAALDNARKAQGEAFLAEVKDWMEIAEITGQRDVKVLNPGVRHTAPGFEYASSFLVNSALKQAGANYIVEVGKLIGNPTRVDEAQRKRSIDVYGPYARTIRIEMSVQVPEGYTVEGLVELAKSVKNDAGSFTAAASLKGNTVSITVEKVYTSAMLPAKDWPQLLAVTDAAADWIGAKVLLRKKG